MQLKLHILGGTRSMPWEIPSRREFTGPNRCFMDFYGSAAKRLRIGVCASRVAGVSDHMAPHLAAIGPAHVQKYASPSRLPQPAAPCDHLLTPKAYPVICYAGLSPRKILRRHGRRQTAASTPISGEAVNGREDTSFFGHIRKPFPAPLFRRYFLDSDRRFAFDGRASFAGRPPTARRS